MHEISFQLVLFILCVGLFTLAAAVMDLRTRKIPNKLTIPVFAAGLVYQAAFNGLPGLADAGWAFLIGFGSLFVLWMIGGGGGGDVKLMGALGVWLGKDMTLYVLCLSTLFVIAGTGIVVLWSVCTRGFRRTKNKFVATGKPREGKKKQAAPETLKQRQNRRIMAYAGPVAVATWLVLLYKLPNLP